MCRFNYVYHVFILCVLRFYPVENYVYSVMYGLEAVLESACSCIAGTLDECLQLYSRHFGCNACKE
jgi:hypothetical protein